MVSSCTMYMHVLEKKYYLGHDWNKKKKPAAKKPAACNFVDDGK